MFSGLASYFLTSEPEPAIPDDIHCQTVEAEDGWLLVDVPGTSIGKTSASSMPEEAHMTRDLTPLFVGVVETPQDCSPTELTPPTSPCPMDGSWFVTPPPCFVARRPVYLETSPLENLLIEHPSMSVYGPCIQTPQALPVRPTPKHVLAAKRLSPAPPMDATSPVLPSSNAANTLTVRRPLPGPRPSAVAARAGWLEQLQGVRPAQRVQICKEQRHLRRGQLERQNRAALEGNRRPKRRDRIAARCSCVNNNRKCC